MKSKCFAIIPARGGSKRIPNKNIKVFAGKPIIKHVISALNKTNLFDEIYVSTDSENIAELACECGANVPFIRPDYLSNDYVGTIDVMKHAIVNLSKVRPGDIIFCVYPTSVFASSEYLVDALSRFKNNSRVDFLISAKKFSYPVQRSFITTEGYIEMLYPEFYNVRSQDLPITWHDAAQFYIAKSSVWLDKEIIYTSKSCLYHMPDYVHDIDNPSDWNIAEILFSNLCQKR
jgi:N-acylneuraminate cytidylyltransferase